MAVLGINRGNSFELLPEGQTVLQIVKVLYKPTFNKIEVTLVNKDGISHVERFFLNKDGGYKAFSFFAHTAVNNWDIDEINTDELIGKFIKTLVIHNVVDSKTNPDTTITFANLKNYESASGWDDVSEAHEDLEDALS